jgi:hypothetical protein
VSPDLSYLPGSSESAVKLCCACTLNLLHPQKKVLHGMQA